MASPVCQVSNNGGAYAPTTNGNDVTPGAPVAIQLVSTAGVKSWAISVIGTDELLAAATINAALTVDGVNKIATFTAPAAGSALIFLSTVTDNNGAVSSTTLGIFTRASGNRVGAVGETFEGSAAYGWASKFNPVIRNPAAAPSATTSAQGIVELAGDLAGNGTTAAAPLVSNISGNSSGYATSSAPNGTQITGNPKQLRTEYPINVVTATTSATAIFTFATTTNRKYSIRAIIEVLNSPVSAYGTWEIDATAVNNAGTLTMITASGGVTQKDNQASFVLTFAASGTNLVVTATDPVGGRRWIGTVYLTEGQF